MLQTLILHLRFFDEISSPIDHSKVVMEMKYCQHCSTIGKINWTILNKIGYKISFNTTEYCLLSSSSVNLLPCIVIQDNLAATFYGQVAAWVPDMLCNFHLVKNHKIANISTTTKVREKISANWESLEFQILFDVCLTKFKKSNVT